MLNIFFVIFVANPGKAWKQEKLGCGWKWRKMFHCLHFPGKEYGWKIERLGMWTVVNSPSFSHWHVMPPRDPHVLVFTSFWLPPLAPPLGVDGTRESLLTGEIRKAPSWLEILSLPTALWVWKALPPPTSLPEKPQCRWKHGLQPDGAPRRGA